MVEVYIQYPEKLNVWADILNNVLINSWQFDNDKR